MPTIFRSITAEKLYHYSLWIISLIISFGALVYYFYALNWLGLIISLVISLSVFCLLTRHSPLLENPSDNFSNKPSIKLRAYLILLFYTISQTILYYYLLNAQSERALLSPWEVINYNFFILFSVGVGLLIIILSKEYFSRAVGITLISIHSFLSLVIAAFIFKIGYGFDPFIHRAALELIDYQGYILPKTPYYLGQYSLIIILHKISTCSIGWLNTFLVPILASIFLPLTIYRFLKHENYFLNISFNLTSIFLISGLLIKPFIITTPQNLSYIFLIICIFNSLNKKNIVTAWLTALASAAIHPLTGLPALIWISWTGLREQKHFNQFNNNSHYKYLKYSASFLLATTLPLVLYLGSGAQLHLKNITSWLWEIYNTFIGAPGLFGSENIFLNLGYFLINNFQLILVTGLVFITIIRQKKSRFINQSSFSNLVIVAKSLFISYLICSCLQFVNVIDYEQSSYSQRIPWLIFFFMLPIIIVYLNKLITIIFSETKKIQVICLFIATGLMSAALYGAYPRFDKYWNSRGYSTSKYDIQAVRAIEADSPGAYAVLANQQVSAAALHEFGFNRYLSGSSGKIYFYPIPTGGPLYQYYLNMVYKTPDRENIASAFTLSGTDTIYLVINRYWNNSRRLIAEAQTTANTWWQIDNEIYIFKYTR